MTRCEEIISKKIPAEEVILLLEDNIKSCAKSYYAGVPEISDADFDEMVEYLRRAKPDSEVLKSVGWGSGIENIPGQKVSHKYQLVGSLNKCKTWDQIPKDIRYGGSKGICVSGKIDGLSLVCYFKDGKLVNAVTRGNGHIGVDRTDKIVSMKPFRKDLPSWFTGAIRGEIVISNEGWDTICSLHSSEDNWPESHHPRNYAAGIFNRNEITPEIELLNYVVYDVVGFDPSDKSYKFEDQDDVISFLQNYFYDVVPVKLLNVIYEDTYYDILENIKDEFTKYPIDGLVLTLNELGYDNSSKAILYNQVAFKFDAEEKSTVIKEIHWTLTRTGRMVPVAEVEPVFLSGARVTRVTCNNAKYVQDNKLGSGAIVTLCRSNEVIPKITSVVKCCDKADLPDRCPTCKELLEWDGADLACHNDNCETKTYRDLQHWVNIIGKVDNIGDTLKFKFLDELNIGSIEDLYSKDWLSIWNDNGQTQRSNFRKVLEKLLKDPVDAVDALCALNIPRLGRASAEKLASDKLLVKSIIGYSVIGMEDHQVYDLVKAEISDKVGRATADSIMSNMERVLNLTHIDERISFSEIIDRSNFIKVSITGSLSVPRKDYTEYLESHGYKVSGIGKDTKYLITNNPDSGSSKCIQAKKLGIQIISERAFNELIE